jgi:hypothetical protein
MNGAHSFDRRLFLQSAVGLMGGAASFGRAASGEDVGPATDTAAFWSSLDRLPMALIVDDPMPCVNPLYYYRTQVRKIQDPPLAKTIPVSLMEQFTKLVVDHGACGGFTIVPFPAGLGSIEKGLSGYDDAEVAQWLELARRHLRDQFDIHPEILTHTLALDLETRELLDVSEHEWMDKQDEQTLTDYFAEALKILKAVGLPAHGVTQPCGFEGDQDVYARALLRAEKLVNNRRQTHYFLDIFQGHPAMLPYCRIANAELEEYVVSIPGLYDFLWPANDGERDASKMADFFLTADGTSGHLAQMITDRRPLVFSTHWQSLYGNGSLAGLHGLQILLERIEQHAQGAEWMKLSTIADLAIQAHREVGSGP